MKCCSIDDPLQIEPNICSCQERSKLLWFNSFNLPHDTKVPDLYRLILTHARHGPFHLLSPQRKVKLVLGNLVLMTQNFLVLLALVLENVR